MFRLISYLKNNMINTNSQWIFLKFNMTKPNTEKQHMHSTKSIKIGI